MYTSYHNIYTRIPDWRKRAGITKLRSSVKKYISDILKSENLPRGTLQKVTTITTVVERELFSHAASEDEYKSPETIIKVLQNNIQGINSNNTIINCQFSNGRTSHLHSSSTPIFSHLEQQQHREHVEMDWMAYNNGSQPSDFVCTPRESPPSIYGDASNFAERRSDYYYYYYYHHHHLESANNMMMDWANYNGNQSSDFVTTPKGFTPSIYGAASSGQGYLEDIFSQPTERMRIEPIASSVSNNDSYKIWDSHMILTNSHERLTKLHQQEESPFPIFSQLTENGIESSTIAMQDSVSFSDANNAIGIEAILLECIDKYKLRDSNPKSIIDEEQDKNGVELTRESLADKVIEPKDDLEEGTMSSKRNPISSGASYDVVEKTNQSGTISEGIEVGNTLEDSNLNNEVKLTDNNPQTDVGGSNLSDHTLQKHPSVDIDDVHGENEFNQSVKNNEREVTEPKSDFDNGEKSSVSTLNVSLPENFTCEQIRNHIMSLRKQSSQSILEKEIEIGDNSCSLCGEENLVFEPLSISCLICDKIIPRDAEYYRGISENNDKERCFCIPCFNNSKGDSIQFNGESFQKELLDYKKNDYEYIEGWVQCDKCQRWQHQICALFNDMRNLEGKSQYVCPECCLKEIEEGIRTPLWTANFGAKDLPRTKLSDHIEQRLYSRLEHERAQKAKSEGKNVDEIAGAENLTVRVVLSVEKKLKVKREFLDIVSGQNYPPEFPYTSKVILLFQNIDGADVLIYVLYVQEFGSECSNPNHRSLHISYLDSVKHFRPQRVTLTGEPLRTFVFHEILIGYLEFCKKRGFEKCYIWACPPEKGDDYLLYCHPKSQKIPQTDQLRLWYLSMIRKASEEDIVVNHTNMYDQFFVASERSNSKVTAARLPYFDGDYWSGAAVDEMKRLEKNTKGDADKLLKQVVTKRTLKSMGHTKPSKDTIKDILVMRKLGKTMLKYKEDFIIAQLQYACTLCHEVILSGKRWFCTECKKYQECERCHTSDTHTSTNAEKQTLCQETGEKHNTLRQAVVDDIPGDTKENDIILDNDLFKSRDDILTFCQENHLQFNTLRHAKFTSMKLIYHLKSSALIHHNDNPRCSICYKYDNGSQLSWQCDVCPKLSICSACYEKKGPNCHEHKLRQCSSSTDHCLPENQGSEQRKTLTKQQVQELLKHAHQCSSTKSQPCSYPNCAQMKRRFCFELKRLISHARGCTVKEHGGCMPCKKARLMLNLHIKGCKNSECPLCRYVKGHVSQRRNATSESAGE